MFEAVWTISTIEWGWTIVLILTQTVFSVHGGNKSSVALTSATAHEQIMHNFCVFYGFCVMAFSDRESTRQPAPTVTVLHQGLRPGA